MNQLLRAKVTILAVFALIVGYANPQINGQSAAIAIPILDGVWNGGFSARPVNGETVSYTHLTLPTKA